MKQTSNCSVKNPSKFTDLHVYIYTCILYTCKSVKLLGFLTFYFLTYKYCSNLKKAEGRNVVLKAGTVRSLLHDALSYTQLKFTLKHGIF